MKNSLIIGIVSVGFLAGAWLFLSNAPSVTQVGGSAFIEGIERTKGAVILDVRTPQEFADGHVRGAMNVDFDAPTFVSEIAKLDKSAPYYMYCRSGNRSGKAITIMTDNGFRNITELRGGIISNQTALQLLTN